MAPKHKGRKRNTKKAGDAAQVGGEQAGANAAAQSNTRASAKQEWEDAPALSESEQLELARKLGGMQLRIDAEAKERAHKFWDTQPVAKMSETYDFSSIDVASAASAGTDATDATDASAEQQQQQQQQQKQPQGPLDSPDKTVADVRQEPYGLPDGFAWEEIVLESETGLSEVYELLNLHYVEDDDNMFRFDYSKNFLRWAVQPPGWRQDWIVGVRNVPTKKLVAFISAVPATIISYGRSIKMVEINFLCVHQKLRDKRLAPVLIKEITRRVNLQNIWQATFTAGKVLPRPVTRCQYYHRSLNPKKLIEVRFSQLAPHMTMARTIRLYKLADAPQLPLRPLIAADVPQACALLNKFLAQFFIKAHFSEEEFAHWFTPREGVVYSYVMADADGKVTDFTSFYSLPSSILNNPKHKTLNAAYSYYSVARTVSLVELVNDTLVLAQQQSFDVFNCLDLMNNQEFLSPLKFGKGDGFLQYYLYNWRCPDMPANKMGLVLL